jgi:hypothetical protein
MLSFIADLPGSDLLACKDSAGTIVGAAALFESPHLVDYPQAARRREVFGIVCTEDEGSRSRPVFAETRRKCGG